MFQWLVSKETKEIASLLCLTINVLRKETHDKGIEAVRQEISKNEIIRQYIPSYGGNVDSFAFYFDKKLQDFLFWVEDGRKTGASLSLFVIAEDERYHGFKLFCDLITGRVTVDAADSFVSGKHATIPARQLCKCFARQYST
jgi:hypothetical protein